MISRWTACLAALIALAAAPPSHAGSLSFFGFGGSGQTLLSQTSVPLRTSGELTVAFHGDVASGCASAGVCSYAGTVVWQPGSDGALAIEKYRQNRRIGYDALVSVGSGNGTVATTARVTRAIQGGNVSTCADVQAPFQLSDTVARRGTVRLQLLTPGSSLLATRCAGPLDGDLAALGPSTTLSLTTALHGRTRLDFRSVHSFAAHGFAGTIRSTIVLALGKPSVATGRPISPPQGKTRRLRFVTQALTMAEARGTVQAAFRGVSNPTVCASLDSCGLTGSLNLQVDARRSLGTLTAIGPASRPDRDFLSALGLSRAGRASGIQVSGGVEVATGVLKALQRQAGAACSDMSRTGKSVVSLVPAHGLLNASFSAENPLRTRCPGPTLSSGPALLTGSVPLRDTIRSPFALRLDHPTSFEDDGYQGSVGGGVTLVLRRGRITQQIFPLPGP